jgi:hypothetical protein
MPKNAKVTRTQKLFMEAMKKKFSEDPDQESWSKTSKESAYTVIKGVAPNRNVGEHVTLIPYAKPRKPKERFNAS